MFRADLIELLKIVLFSVGGSLIHIWLYPEESRWSYFISFCMSMLCGITVYYLLIDFAQYKHFAHIGCSFMSIASKDLMKSIIKKVTHKIKNHE